MLGLQPFVETSAPEPGPGKKAIEKYEKPQNMRHTPKRSVGGSLIQSLIHR